MPRLIGLTGGPLAGKSTAAKRLALHGAHVISTSSIVQKLAPRKSRERHILDLGGMYPDETKICSEVREQIVQQIALNQPHDIVVDGFPRRYAQTIQLKQFEMDGYHPIVAIMCTPPMIAYQRSMGLDKHDPKHHFHHQRQYLWFGQLYHEILQGCYDARIMVEAVATIEQLVSMLLQEKRQ